MNKTTILILCLTCLGHSVFAKTKYQMMDISPGIKIICNIEHYKLKALKRCNGLAKKLLNDNNYILEYSSTERPLEIFVDWGDPFRSLLGSSDGEPFLFKINPNEVKNIDVSKGSMLDHIFRNDISFDCSRRTIAECAELYLFVDFKKLHYRRSQYEGRTRLVEYGGYAGKVYLEYGPSMEISLKQQRDFWNILLQDSKLIELWKEDEFSINFTERMDPQGSYRLTDSDIKRISYQLKKIILEGKAAQPLDGEIILGMKDGVEVYAFFNLWSSGVDVDIQERFVREK